MSAPWDDLEGWAKDYRQVRRPDEARRTAIIEAIARGSATDDLGARRRRRLAIVVALAAALLLALGIARLLPTLQTRSIEHQPPSLAPHAATGGEEGSAIEPAAEPTEPTEPTEPAAAPTGEPEAPQPSPALPPPHSPQVEQEPSVPLSPPPSSSSDVTDDHSPRSAPPPRPRRSASPEEPAQSSPPDARADLESLELLRAAQRSLDAEPAAALQLLREHEQRFEQSPMALERSALRVIALCRLGRMDAGLELQRRFLEAHGASAYASRVRQACPEPSAP